MNRAELEERLLLLVDQQVITTHASDVTKLAFERLIDSLNVRELEQAEMLFTHLPTALSRIGNGESVEGPAPEIMSEIKTSPHFHLAEKQVIFIEGQWGKELPLEEKEYLYMHYTNVINLTVEGE
ncbi:PRD domain-containing protein [Virgibacillus necropolis]|uniref:PRD domain-containing protein n=1 Tax=Virgibacillus necropolis TaxID=163877 RepID=A0A221MA56_9BACI|nr:PRD domain-containing protein [Virgibacillus necropolis]ASN04534.1 PRD domain-containing protein [Virgibacillus necropolis]